MMTTRAGTMPRVIAIAFLIVAVLACWGTARARAIPGKAYVISITRTIEPGLAAYVERAIREATAGDASCLLFEIDTFGGRVDAAIEIKDAIMGTGIPTIAFVKGRAWSAGALIALAAEHIAMAPGSSIGAAEPRPTEEKEISALRSEFESTAQARGRNARIAGAMVDKEIEIEGVIERGKLLTLTATEARKLGIADAVLSSREEALRHFGFGGATLVPVRITAAEQLARFVTDPSFAGLLLVIGFLGLAVEIVTPGFGVPGILGLIALALFFGGRIFAGVAGFEVLVLFIVGFILLLLEVFVIPGFGVAGIAGIASIIGSLFLSFSSVQEAANVIGASFLATVALGVLVFRYLGKRPAFRQLVLGVEQGKDKGYVATRDLGEYLGAVGRTLTVLRPAGAIIIGDQKLDVISEGEFIPKDVTVKVIRVEGSKLVVRRED